VRKNPTHLTRAARKLQQKTTLTYAQALNLLRRAGTIPNLDDPQEVATFLAHRNRQTDNDTTSSDTPNPVQDALVLTATQLSGWIDELEAEEAASEVIGPILGADIAEAGRDLVQLLDGVIVYLGEQHPLASELRTSRTALDEAVSVYDSLDEHTPNTATAILDQVWCLTTICRALGISTEATTCRHCSWPVVTDREAPTGWTHVQVGGKSGGTHCNPEYTAGHEHTVASPVTFEKATAVATVKPVACSVTQTGPDVVWADENGEFVLTDGSTGNPGCDCGYNDAVVRINGEYLCASEARQRDMVVPDQLLDRLDDEEAAQRIAAAHTTEAGNLELLVSLAQTVIVLRDDDGTWHLHCMPDNDLDNEAWVDRRITEPQLRHWLGAVDLPSGGASWRWPGTEVTFCPENATRFWRCDECEHIITQKGTSSEHDSACSLHPDNVVDPDGRYCRFCNAAGRDYHIIGAAARGENNICCDNCWDERLR
jgi:hypothetical protein